MANSDGSVIIDTELDNSGFERNADKLLYSIKELVSSVRTIGTSIEKAVQTSLPLLQRMTDMLSEAYGSVESSGAKISASNDQWRHQNNKRHRAFHRRQMLYRIRLTAWVL